MEIGVIFIIIHTNVGKTARDRPKPSVSHAKRKPTMLISFEWPMIFKTTTDVHVPHKRKSAAMREVAILRLLEKMQCHVMTCPVMSCHVMSCHVMRHVMSCHDTK